MDKGKTIRIKDHIDLYHWERKSRLFQKSTGFKILFNYLRDLFLTEEFRVTMVKMRNCYKIPPSGFVIEGKGPWTHPPKEWNGDRAILAEIRKEMRTLAADYFFLPRDWSDVFESFLFYNKIQIALEPNAYNLSFVSDLKTNTDTRGRTTTPEEINAFPVALHISPYASKRSILDYVEKFYKTEIATLQDKYKNPRVEIGRHKTKQEYLRKRNTLIYSNRHLPRKTLVKMANAQFPKAEVDQGSVGKIISIEVKRRKEA